uniref:NADH dehydrogenase subunit 4L n=1 Tax=Achatinella mustelina TaxID=115943 RepID=A0A336U877_9EUPU|nr:NADH dehydrogenase subunit 4L [Achatinella mustelina]ANC62882.1 NADH dehydrogenase subunit 4L [Achatinella mustelina]
MTLNYLTFLWCIFLLVVFSMQRFSLLNCLILLESLVLFSIFYCYYNLLVFEGSINFILFLLVLAASEAAIGLTILVMVIRLYSNDLFSSMNLFAKNWKFKKYFMFT